MGISKRKIILPAIMFVLLIAVWQLSIDFFKIPNYLLPSPKSVSSVCASKLIRETFAAR